MSNFDKVRMELPDGTVFVGQGNLRVAEVQQPAWLFDGGGDLVTAAGEFAGLSGSLKAQVFEGVGAGIRTWRVEFVQWEGNSDQWGGAAASDDVIVKLQTLGHAIAHTRITSSAPAELQFGEYSTNGKYAPVDVVPGEVELPIDLGETPSTATPRVDWVEAIDTSVVQHIAP